jgi:hypothetical protein
MENRSIGRNAIKAKERTLKVIKGYFNNANWLNDEFVDAAANPNHLSTIDYIENKLKEMCFHSGCSDSIIRLEPIMMSVALSLGFEQEKQKVDKLNRLYLIIDYIKEHYKDEDFNYKLNRYTINDTTYDLLNKHYGKIIDMAYEKEDIESNSISIDNMNPDYEVIEIEDYNQAHEIGEYSHSKSKLCYTQREGVWKQYTNDGINNVYCILKKDYKYIAENKFEGNEKHDDSYGKSMIFLFISPDGNISYSNSRYNHQAKDSSIVDKCFSKVDISKLLNVNFSSIFKGKPIDVNELFEITLFNKYGYAFVKRRDKKINVIDLNGNIMFDEWFNHVSRITDELFTISFDTGNVYNDYICMTNGSVILKNIAIFEIINVALKDTMVYRDSDDYIISLKETKTFFIILKNGKYNVIDENLNYIIQDCDHSISSLGDNLVLIYQYGIKVKIFNLIDKSFVFDEIFDIDDIFIKCYMLVIKKDEYYYFYDLNSLEFKFKIDSNYELKYPVECGFVIMNRTFQCAIIDFNGNQLTDFLNSQEFINSDKIIIEKGYKKYNACNLKGDLLFDRWYDGYYPMTNGYLAMYVNDEESSYWCIFDRDNKEIQLDTREYNICCLKKNFDYYVTNNYDLVIEKNGLFNVFDVNEKKIKLDTWYEQICPFRLYSDYYKVKLNGKCNIIKDGKTILENWYDDVDVTSYKNVIVTNNKLKGIFKIGEENKVKIIYDSIKGIAGNEILAIVSVNNMDIIFNINKQEEINFNGNNGHLMRSAFNKINCVDTRYAEVIFEDSNTNFYNLIDLEKDVYVLTDNMCNEFQAKFQFAKYLFENNEYDKEKHPGIYLYI